jgi:Spy/CpxP family protein refolding chaperone
LAKATDYEDLAPFTVLYRFGCSENGASGVIVSTMKLASLALASVLAASTFIACGGSVEQPQNTAQAASKAPIGANSRGAVKLVGQALGEVALRPEQRTEIEKLATDAEARHAPLFEGKKQLMLAFADQIEKGSVDRAALQPSIDKLTADAEKSRLDDRAAIAKLHDLLDKEQRNDFVDALEKQLKAKRDGFAGEGFGHLHKLAEDLKLTDDQRDKIKDVFKESWRSAKHERHSWGGHGGHHGKSSGHALEAFREDKLDLDKVAPPMDLKKMATGGTENVTNIAGKILPILTPEQRKIAADKLREMANKGDSSLLVH